MPHGRHIYAKSSDIAKAKMCSYPQSYHALPNWKYILPFCAQCPSVNIPDRETYYQYSNSRTSIIFHIYHLIAHCKTHGRILLNNNSMLLHV